MDVDNKLCYLGLQYHADISFRWRVDSSSNYRKDKQEKCEQNNVCDNLHHVVAFGI